MAAKPDSLPVHLWRIDEGADRRTADGHDPKPCMAASEENSAGVRRRIGRLELRVERIERRFDPVDTPH